MLIAGTGGIEDPGSLGRKGGRGLTDFFFDNLGVGGRSAREDDDDDADTGRAMVLNEAGRDFDGRTIMEIFERRDSRRAVGFGAWISTTSVDAVLATEDARPWRSARAPAS